MAKGRHFGVVLSGCGYLDGGEIHESVMTLLAIRRRGGTYQCYAPDVPQARVVDHKTGKTAAEARNVLAESARIARGDVADLSAFDPDAVDALVFPGGYGAALNLSTFESRGAACEVLPDVRAAIEGMRARNKPIGALCISPVLLARVIGGGTYTVGGDPQVEGELAKLGAAARPARHGEVIVDPSLKLASSPCYMMPASVEQIAEDADKLIEALIALM